MRWTSARSGHDRTALRFTSRAAAPGFVVVVATDAPLFSGQLNELAEAALRGIDAAVPQVGVESRRAIAFSTANGIEGSLEKEFRLYPARRLGDAGLGALLDAAAAVTRAALRRALAEAKAVTGRKGRTAAPVEAGVVAGLSSGL